ncbi:MAG: hypothetical protein II453_14560 [Alphaproteobacteria bacterium]|nr:hypothetical protein [Alphaproteobacteria bacterium]
MKHNIKHVRSLLSRLGISENTYYSRIRRGWTLEEALSIPKIGAVHILNGKSVYSLLTPPQYLKFLRYYSKTKNLNTAFTKARSK